MLWLLACTNYPASAGTPPAPHAFVVTPGRLREVERLTGLPCYDRYALSKIDVLGIEASSTLTAGQVYDAERLTDAYPKTAWCEGVNGDGVGESLFLTFAPGEPPQAIEILPGYAKDKATFFSNRRVAELRVRFFEPKSDSPMPSGGWRRGDLVPIVDEELVASLAPADMSGAMGFQTIDIGNYWLQNMFASRIAGVELTILAVDGQGARYEDTCVSEIELFTLADGPPLGVRCEPGWCASQRVPPPGCAP